MCREAYRKVKQPLLAPVLPFHHLELSTHTFSLILYTLATSEPCNASQPVSSTAPLSFSSPCLLQSKHTIRSSALTFGFIIHHLVTLELFIGSHPTSFIATLKSFISLQSLSSEMRPYHSILIGTNSLSKALTSIRSWVSSRWHYCQTSF